MELSVHNKVSHVTVAIESVCIRTPRRMTKVGLLLLCAVFGCAFAATPTEKCTGEFALSIDNRSMPLASELLLS